MTVVDPSGNDDHGRMPVTSVDRPWITRGVSHATLEGRPPTTAITRQENADCPSYTRNHLAFLLRNARERKRLPFPTFFRILVAKRKKEKKKKSEIFDGAEIRIWPVSKCWFFGMAPARVPRMVLLKIYSRGKGARRG